MMQMLAPHWQLLSAPWRQRYTEKSFGGIVAMALLLLALGGVLGYLKGGDAQSMLRAFCGAGAGLIQVLLLLQIMSMVQYNHPTHARLVPGNLQRLRETMVATWLLAALLCGALMGVGFGNGGHWFLAAAVCMLVLATSVVWPVLWFAAFFFPWWFDFGFTDFVRQSLVPAYQTWPLLCGAVVLALGARFLTHVVLQDGNAKHAMHFDRLRRLRWAAMPNAQGRQASLHLWGSWGTRLLRVVLYPLHRYMLHRVRNPRRTPANVMARAEWIFGADVHWVMQASVACCIAGMVGIACLAASFYWGAGWQQQVLQGLPGLSLGMLFLALTPAMGLHAGLYRSRREQSLIMLLPGMPQGTALNRLLTTRLLRQTGIAWLVVACVASQFTFVPGTAELVAAAYIGLLPASALLVQDWSRLQAQRVARSMFYSTMTLAGPIACFLAMYWLHVDATYLFLANLLIAVALLRWRWMRLQDFPAALPTGRLAAV